ncbi:MAG: O-antigen ligase family protein [Planctomycetota bacterium]|jgi:O-antigen ligase
MDRFTPEESHATPPAWLSILLWVALGAMVLSPLFPRMPAAMNLGTTLGVIALVLRQWLCPAPILRERPLKLCLIGFLVLGLISAFLPGLTGANDTALMLQCFHRYADTLKAVLGAALVLVCIRRPEQLAAAALVTLLLAFAILLWAPFDFWLRGEMVSYFLGWLRLEGTRGNAHRYAMILYYLMVPLIATLFSCRLRKATLSKGAIKVGYLLCAALPFLLMRAKLPPPAPLGNLTPIGAHPASHLAFMLLAGGVAIVTLFFWRFLVRPGRARTTALLTILSLLMLNLILSGVGLHILLCIGLLLGVLLLNRWFRLIWVALPLVLLAASIGFFQAGAPAKNLSSLSHRVQIWKGSLQLAKESPALGVGYGQNAFLNAWLRRFSSPGPDGRLEPTTPGIPPKAYHAHNLWLELVVERGGIGLLAFHTLWGAAIYSLIRRALRLPDATTLKPAAYASLLLLVFLAFDGILNWPLVRYNELLFWVMATAGIAATGLGEEGRKDSAPKRGQGEL